MPAAASVQPFKIGDRVRIRDAIRKRLGAVGANIPDGGEVVEIGTGEIIKVRFDGRERGERYHVSMIEAAK